MESDFNVFLSRLFREGDVSFLRGPSPLTAVPPPGATDLLERAYDAYRLDIAGRADRLRRGARLPRRPSWSGRRAGRWSAAGNASRTWSAG